MTNDDISKPGRRNFLVRVAASTTALPFAVRAESGAALAGGTSPTSALQSASAVPAPTSSVAPTVGYVCFSQDEAALVEAMMNVMCPADNMTPNGVDCGLATYIDRQLAGDFGRGWKRYTLGPWQTGKPQQGFQLPLSPQQWFKAGAVAVTAACQARKGKPFDQLTVDESDAFLTDLSTGKVVDASVNLANWFNDLMYPLFNQACFADPAYGGNFDKVFWKLIGYPGLPATNSINMVQYRGKPFPGAGAPKSMVDFS